MSIPAYTPGVRRYSLLRRNAAHTPSFFSEYYEKSHGPLAARTAGFRKYTTRYLQNHVEATRGAVEPAFDGVTMTTQLPRENYVTEGFFVEPDYEQVKPDESFLFDLSRTVSLLGTEHVVLDGEATALKAIVLGSGANVLKLTHPGLTRVVDNQLETRGATVLGFEKASFPFDRLLELWFEDEAARSRALQVPRDGDGHTMFAVREIEIFGPNTSC